MKALGGGAARAWVARANGRSAPAEPPPAVSTEHRPTILLFARTGFSLRYLAQSDVLPSLIRGGARVVILSPRSDRSDLVDVEQNEHVHVVTYDDARLRQYQSSSRLQRFFLAVRRLGTQSGFSLRRAKEFQAELRGRFYWRAVSLLVLATAAAAWRWRVLRRALLFIEERLFPGPLGEELFGGHVPDLVVIPSLGNVPGEQYVIRSARRVGAKVVATVLSWDNTTTKGLPGAEVDYAVAWTEHMRRELVSDLGLSSERVFVSGVAHFDRHVQARLPSREQFCREHALDPDRALICLGTISPTRWNWNADLVEILADAISAGRFVRPCRLLVRVHPIHLASPEGVPRFEATLERYRRIAAEHPHVRFEYPDVATRLTLQMTAGDMRTLSSILKHTDVLVSFFSTLNLEAAIFDTPCVNVCFNGKANVAEVPERIDIRQALQFDHIQRLLSYGAGSVAFSAEQLIDQINVYLDDPSVHREGRRTLKEGECGPHLGSAGATLGRILLKAAGLPR